MSLLATDDEQRASLPSTDDGPCASIRIRPMTADDIDGVLAIESLAGARGWTRRTFETELADPATRRYLVAEEAGSGRIVGFAGLRLVVDEACVTNVAVRPEVRRRGVATRLVTALLDDARRSGATAATLEVREGNVPARALYRHLGFADEGIRPRYYADGEDAVIMWRREPAEGRE